MTLRLLVPRIESCKSSRRGILRLAMCSVLWGASWFSTSAAAQNYTLNTLSTNAQPRPATDGTNVVTTDTTGDIVVIPFVGGTATNLVPAGVALPDGLGAATSYTAFGVPQLVNNVVYFGALSATGSGYFSIPVTGGSIHTIVDSTLQDSSGRSVGSAALPQELQAAPFLNYFGLPIPGIGSNLFVDASGGATFTANPTSNAAPQRDLAVMNLSPSGTLSSVIDTNSLSGCTRISNFATDGTIFAIWALSTNNHLLLLENSGATLSCNNTILDLGAPGVAANSILPGQPSMGSIMEDYVASSTVIDSGYVYFSATITLTDTTINSGNYSGIFRIRPGGSVEKVIATDHPQLGTPGTVDLSGTGPLAVCSSFAVRGDYVVFATGWLGHYGWAGGLHPVGLLFFDQATATLRTVASVENPITPTRTFYVYGGTAPTQASLSADGKFTFEITTQDISNVLQFTINPTLYTVNLLENHTTTALTASAATAPAGTAVTLTAVVTAAQGTPSGTVTFSSNGFAIGSSAVDSSGTAVLVVNDLPIGTDSIQAVFAGTTPFPSSTSSAVSVIITEAPSFGVSSSSTSLTIKQGQTGSTTISLTPVGGFSAAVEFSCSGLPLYATCAFSPQSVNPGASVATTTVTIATNVQTSHLQWPSSISYAGLVALGLGGFLRRFRRGIHTILGLLCWFLLAAALSAVVGCGSSHTKSNVTPAGVSNVTVTATSGSNVKFVNLTVSIVQ